MAEISNIAVRVTDWHDPVGMELRDRQLKEILADIEGETQDGTAPSATDIEAFILLEVDGTAIACAGLRPLLSAEDPSESAAEVKRMFVVPEQRGSRAGVTSHLMEVIEKEAKGRGYKTLKLATGTQMHRARAFYEKHGFVQTPLFGPYVRTVATICYVKQLT